VKWEESKRFTKNLKKILFVFCFCFSLFGGEYLPLLLEGNKEISERELYECVNLYKPYFYEFYKDAPAVHPKTAELLVQSIKNFYKSRGFFDARVQYTQTQEAIVVSVCENEPILIADLSTLSELKINSQIPLKEGDTFDAQKFTQSKKDIKNFYAQKGYCHAQLKAKAWIDTEMRKAYLFYETTPNELCYFAKIEISPSQNIESKIIESLLYIKKDDLFSMEKITQSYENLYGYDGISKAIIDTDMDENNSVNVNVSVSENEKPIRFQAGLGGSSDEGAMVSLGVKHRNLGGNLKTLSLNTRLTQIKQTIQTNFDMPLANKNSTGLEAGLANESFAGFKEKRAFGSIYLGQRIIPHSLKESLVFDSSITYASDDEILFPEKGLFLISPKLEYNYEKRDKILDSSKGYFVHSEVMGSMLSEISDASYYKYKLTGGYIIPFEPSVLGFKASFGSLHIYEGDIPSSYRFFAGGMNSNRGYGYRSLGPKNSNADPTGSDSILEITAEWRFFVYENFKGVIFSDNTFISNSEVPDYERGYYSAGIGLRYITPIGPIAIDVGCDLSKPTKQYAFHFHVGELF